MGSDSEHHHKQDILEAADRMFARHGYRRTTIEDIAKEASIGKGSVYLHFTSKEDIGSQWFEGWHAKVLSAMQADVDAAEGYSAKVRALLHRRVLARYCALERWQMSVHDILESLEPLIRTHKAKFQEREASYLVEILNEGVRDGAFRKIDVGKVAASMLLATNALLPYNARPNQIGDRDAVDRMTSDLIDLLMQAIEPQGATL
jgi:AcrR family transcriptional regulator